MYAVMVGDYYTCDDYPMNLYGKIVIVDNKEKIESWMKNCEDVEGLYTSLPFSVDEIPCDLDLVYKSILGNHQIQTGEISYTLNFIYECLKLIDSTNLLDVDVIGNAIGESTLEGDLSFLEGDDVKEFDVNFYICGRNDPRKLVIGCRDYRVLMPKCSIKTSSIHVEVPFHLCPAAYNGKCRFRPIVFCYSRNCCKYSFGA